MMSWRSLSPKTIVAAAEAVARRKADAAIGSTPTAGAASAGRPDASAPPRPANNAGAISPRRSVE